MSNGPGGIGIRRVLAHESAEVSLTEDDHVVETHRRECFDHVIVRNERHLCRVFREYVQFPNDDRSHQL